MQPRQAPPEFPFPDYPRPHPFSRVLTAVRDHGFGLALVATGLLIAAGVLHLKRWNAAETTQASLVLRGTSATSGFPGDSLAVLAVDTYPNGAELFLDGTSLGLTPRKQLRLPPGTYRLALQHPGYEAVDSTITLVRGESALLFIPLAAGSREEDLFTISPEAPPPRRGGTRRPRAPARPAAEATPPPGAPERVAAADVRDLTYGQIVLRSEPSGAAVWLNDRLMGSTPLSLSRVVPGEYVFSFRKPGFESSSTLLVLQPGQTAIAEPRLAPLTGTLRVLARPWGSIYVNGELKQESSDVRYSAHLPPGRYRVTVVHPVLGRWDTVANIQAGKDASFVVDLNDPDRPQQTADDLRPRGW